MADRLKGKIRAIANEILLLRGTAESVNYSTIIKGAIGVQLDSIGALIGEPRKGRPDSSYRKAIEYRSELVLSCGDNDSILKAARIELPSGVSLKLRERFPATIELIVNTPAGNSGVPSDFVQRVKHYKAGGVKIYAREVKAGKMYLTWEKEGSVDPLPGKPYSERKPDGTILHAGGYYGESFF